MIMIIKYKKFKIFIKNPKINPENGKRLIFGKTNYNNYVDLCKIYGYIISDEDEDDEDDEDDNYSDIIFTKIRDIDIKILLDLDDYDLNKVCRTNKYVNSLCNDDYFWKFKLDNLIGMDLFPTNLRNQGKEIYQDIKKNQKYIDITSDLSINLGEKLQYIANWAIINNYPSIIDSLLTAKLVNHINQDDMDESAFRGNIEVLNVLADHIRRSSSSNNPAMLKYLSKGLFPNVKGANLAALNNQYDVLDLLKKFNIHPDYNYTDINLKPYIKYAIEIKDDELLAKLEDIEHENAKLRSASISLTKTQKFTIVSLLRPPIPIIHRQLYYPLKK
jgi:hypothetical protein